MTTLLRTTAAVVWPIFFLFVFVLFKLISRKSKIYSFSDLGSSNKFGNMFNLVLIVVGTLQSIFLLNFLNQFYVATLFLVSTSMLGVLAGIMNQGDYFIPHKIISCVGIGLSAPGWVILGLTLIKTQPILGPLLLGWGIAIIPLTLFVVTKYPKKLFLCELFFFFGAFLTNVALLILK